MFMQDIGSKVDTGLSREDSAPSGRESPVESFDTVSLLEWDVYPSLARPHGVLALDLRAPQLKIYRGSSCSVGK
jgi:hypothetical protein